MGRDPEGKEPEEKTIEPAREREKPGDNFYHGVITKIFWGNSTGVIRSDTGREVPFTFAFVTLIGAPRHDLRYLCEGMRVGFDVDWTSKGLRATVIKVYEDS